MEKNNLRKFLYNIIEMADYIFISKHKILNNNDKKEIILILKSFYKYSNNILYLIEKEEQCFFSQIEITNFEKSCSFLIDLIDKNYMAITNLIKKEEETEWEISYAPIIYRYFKETYQLRCQELLKKCKI